MLRSRSTNELPMANLATELEVKASPPKPSTHAPKVSIRNHVLQEWLLPDEVTIEVQALTF